MNKIKIGLIVFLAAVALSCRTDAPAITTIYIVRHAEKNVSDPKNQDPELSSEGMERAEALADKLKEIKLDAAFATKYKRTSQTAYYSSKNSNIEIQNYDAHDFSGIAELVKTKHSGHKVLIVGHSNTVLELLEAFGAQRPLSALSDDDYDFFFELRVDPKGKAELKTLHYGKAHHSSIIK
ncbi:MAG: histidine phosphatase family protein [Pedobacter sp.]|nr:histidine phosphatase family protein [Pedobacter sp.]